MNHETHALCTVAHECGYQVGRRLIWSGTRYIRPLGYHADPQRMENMLVVLGARYKTAPWGCKCGHPAFRMDLDP